MNRRLVFLLFLVGSAILLPFRAPAPLYYTPGQGWYYEPFGQKADWMRPRAKEQLEVAEQAFTNANFSVSLHAAHRVLRMWPLSDYASGAEFVIGRCLEEKGKDEAAFNAYQSLIQKYPHSPRYNEVLWRQYYIANRFLNGKWFRLWGIIPLYRSMDQTAKLFSTIVTNGPYSDVAPYAQLRVGAAREFQKDYPAAVKAYATAADRYYNQPGIVADALYREGVAYYKQARTAEYDQSTASEAIATFTDFITLCPKDPRVPEAQKAIAALKLQQVEGNFKIAQFYEHNKVLNAQERRNGALVYYSLVVQLNPNSPLAAQARQRIAQLKSRAVAPPAG